MAQEFGVIQSRLADAVADIEFFPPSLRRVFNGQLIPHTESPDTIDLQNTGFMEFITKLGAQKVTGGHSASSPLKRCQNIYQVRGKPIKGETHPGVVHDLSPLTRSDNEPPTADGVGFFHTGELTVRDVSAILEGQDAERIKGKKPVVVYPPIAIVGVITPQGIALLLKSADTHVPTHNEALQDNLIDPKKLPKNSSPIQGAQTKQIIELCQKYHISLYFSPTGTVFNKVEKSTDIPSVRK